LYTIAQQSRKPTKLPSSLPQSSSTLRHAIIRSLPGVFSTSTLSSSLVIDDDVDASGPHYCGLVMMSMQMRLSLLLSVTLSAVLVVRANDGRFGGRESCTIGDRFRWPLDKGKVSPAYVSVPILMGPSSTLHTSFCVPLTVLEQADAADAAHRELEGAAALIDVQVAPAAEGDIRPQSHAAWRDRGHLRMLRAAIVPRYIYITVPAGAT